MCLYPKLIKNKKYTKNKKNGGVIPAVSDKRVLAVPIGCGNCLLCRKKKANSWRNRLIEECKNDLTGVFVTLTFNSAGAGSGSIGGTPSAPDTGVINGVGMGLQLGLMDAQKRLIS